MARPTVDLRLALDDNGMTFPVWSLRAPRPKTIRIRPIEAGKARAFEELGGWIKYVIVEGGGSLVLGRADN